MVKVYTQYRRAISSADYSYPQGAKYDNHTSWGFIREVNDAFRSKKLKVLDLGCAGGQYVIDMNSVGHLAIGLEGSDYNLVNKQFNWPNEHLFTCDISKPFYIVEYDDQVDDVMKFDLVTAWEVLEHLSKEEMGVLFSTIYSHLAENGFVLISVGFKPNPVPGTNLDLHVTQMNEENWRVFLSYYWKVSDYPFVSAVRGFGSDLGESFLFRLDKKPEWD